MLGAPIELRDGSHIRVRQGHSSDRDLLLRGFARLGEVSRYRRFLVAMPELSDQMVSYLTEIDHHNHEALIALEERTGEGIGVARFVRDPERPDAAEVAVAVIDEWQGKGVGTVLLETIGARAREEGIATFTAVMLATNQQMLELLTALGEVTIVDRDVGTVEVEVPLQPVGLAPALTKLLKIAARTRASDPGGERRP